MEGVVQQTRVTIKCPGCGKPVEAVATDGVVKGWCAESRKYVIIPVKATE